MSTFFKNLPCGDPGTSSEVQSALFHFQKWYVSPLSSLADHNPGSGDGGFLVMSVGCALCERWHRIKTGTQNHWDDNKTFRKDAAAHLDVKEDFFGVFWEVFRNGIQHQCHPKWCEGDGHGRKPYKWSVSNDFKHFPELKCTGEGNSYIEVVCIDPFKFTEHYMRLFLNEPANLTESLHYNLGCVGVVDLRPIDVA